MNDHSEYMARAYPKEPAVDTMASERLLRLPQVMALVGLRRTAIYQRMKEGRFPKSRSLGPRCTVWVGSEIDAWLAEIRDADSEA